MSDTMTATTDQWMQFYQQPLTDFMALSSPIEGFSDATVVKTSPSMSSEGILSPKNSYTTTGQLIPKGNIAFKPIRRRSRASKRTPITLLNANTTNFRELVQQFTGCPRTSMSSFSVHKGPITLNFQQGSRQQIHHHKTTTSTMPPFGSTSYNQVHDHVQKQQEQLPKQQLLQEQQSGYSLEHVKSSNIVPTLDSSRPSMEFSDGLLMNNDFSLHEPIVNSFSYDTKINDGFFM